MTTSNAPKNHVARGILLTAIGACCWGFSGTCAQLLTSEYGIPVAWLITVRMCAGALLFLAVCLGKNWRSFRAALRDTRSLVHIVIFGLFGVLLTQFSYITCISYTNAGTGTVLERLGLVIILFYICVTVRRLPHLREAVGVVLALAGVFLIATHGNVGALAIPPQGLFWGLMTAVAMACYTLMPVKPLAKWGSFIVTGIAMSTAAVSSAVILQPWKLDVAVTPAVVAIVAVMVVVGTFAAYLFYLQGVNDAGSMRAGLVGCLEPVSAIVISAVWLHTPISVFDIVGAVLILAMVVLTTQKEEAAEHDKFSGSLRDVPLFQGSASRLGYYESRKATAHDFNAFSAVLETGHATMAELGVSEQGDKKYPSERRVMRAIDHGDAYVVTMDAEAAKAAASSDDASVIDAVALDAQGRRIIGVFSLDMQGDASYARATGATWTDFSDMRKRGESEYAALHWVTVDPIARRSGVGMFILGEAERMAKIAGKACIRADVYEDNAPTRRLFEHYGFHPCGTIVLKNSLGRKRRRAAYELIL
ncbi:MAG: GNAT family N-acetyltransferase [Slackia sp.]|nr:GNAT family N-acetyltransferase [Slackia sp.]